MVLQASLEGFSDYPDAIVKWAIGAIGIVIGYWLVTIACLRQIRDCLHSTYNSTLHSRRNSQTLVNTREVVPREM